MKNNDEADITWFITQNMKIYLKNNHINNEFYFFYIYFYTYIQFFEKRNYSRIQYYLPNFIWFFQSDWSKIKGNYPAVKKRNLKPSFYVWTTYSTAIYCAKTTLFLWYIFIVSVDQPFGVFQNIMMFIFKTENKNIFIIIILVYFI